MEKHSATQHTSLKNQGHERKTRLFYIKEAEYTATQINMWRVIGSWIFKKLAGHYWTVAEIWIWTFYYIIISSWKDWRQEEQCKGFYGWKAEQEQLLFLRGFFCALWRHAFSLGKHQGEWSSHLPRFCRWIMNSMRANENTLMASSKSEILHLLTQTSGLLS